MTTEAVTTFFAVLALLCQVAVVLALVLVVAARLADGPARLLARVRLELGPTGLWLAAAIAVVATLGSLYLSEIAGFEPCRYCWFQRIAMYPLAVILPIAAVRRDVSVRIYAIPLAAVGAAIGAYHRLLQQYPSLSGDSCDLANPCSGIWVQHFGYVTIPTMALSGFLAIIAVLALTPAATAAPEDPPPGEDDR